MKTLLRTLSIILAILLIVAAIGNIFLIINNKQAVWNVIAIAELLAVSTLLMVAAKYYDKAAVHHAIFEKSIDRATISRYISLERK